MNYGMRPGLIGRKILAVLAAETAFYGIQATVPYSASAVEELLDVADIGRTNVGHQLDSLAVAGYVKYKPDFETGETCFTITLAGMRVALGVLG